MATITSSERTYNARIGQDPLGVMLSAYLTPVVAYRTPAARTSRRWRVPHAGGWHTPAGTIRVFRAGCPRTKSSDDRQSPAMSCWARSRAWAIGMTNPMLLAWVPWPLAATAVLMPTTWPEALANGPPELPELIAASVWIRPSRWPSSVSIVRPSADTIPWVTVGPPSRARALPIATTGSPTATSPLANVAGVTPDGNETATT